jgi:lipopolysaccharide export system protein LptA
VVGGEDEPVVFSSRLFEWDAATRTARYRGTPEGPPALLRSGSDEIRAALIEVSEKADGESSLEATGGVTSLLHTRPEEPGAEATALDASADSMLYEESREQVVYKGSVRLAQGAIVTRSPEATLTLVPGGGRIEKLEAGEPVEIVEGERKVNGERALYTPGTETVVVEGERVVFVDPGRQIEGRRLEFRVADEKLEVGSEQQARTTTVFLGRQH